MPLVESRLEEIVVGLASQPGHEQVRVLVQMLLVDGLGAELTAVTHEMRIVEARGRIDALLGRTLLEFKSDLQRERRDAEEELSRYLPERQRATGELFVGLATDGLNWVAYEWRDGALAKLREYRTKPDNGRELLVWLDGVVATRAQIPPDALNIQHELGQQSIAFQRALAGLSAAWQEVAKTPTASLQRQLWERLLTLVYGREIKQDELWFQHTFLVVVAKAIAAHVLGVESDDPRAILTGSAFRQARVFGAVESDFFDWILAAPSGSDLVRRIARHVGRFRLRDVKTDVLKILYESLIDREERHSLGEYYTPDWLASKIVARAIENPLEQKVLDPACGSGTFLFHAVRRFLHEAEDAGLDPAQRASEAAAHVAGMDIHPVAVIIARVTYLLALMPALSQRMGDVAIPVYLGDALQLDVREYMKHQELTIIVPPKPGEPEDMVVPGEATGGARSENGVARLAFPEVFCREPALFDKLIEAMREASDRDQRADAYGAAGKRIVEQHHKRDLTSDEESGLVDLGRTFKTYDALRRAGRNSIWTYVARNLSRPLAFSAFGGWANVLIGNPPWLAYRHMTPDLQKRFKTLAKNLAIYEGGKLATQNDLCALFLVRAGGLYLRSGGRLAMVLPLAALTRGQYAKLRSGGYANYSIAFEEAWTMDDEVKPLFPVPSCVVFGRRRAIGKPTPERVRAYRGRLPYRDASEEVADARLSIVEDALAPSAAVVDHEDRRSPYQSAFKCGATLFPRMLFFVERRTAGRLGGSTSMPLVASRRGVQDKKPWRDLPGLQHAVEQGFLRPVLLGESILPFRLWRPFEGVVPITDSGVLLDARASAARGFTGLGAWMREAEAVWTANGRSPMTLIARWNYHNGLTSQLPVAPIRVLYTASGTHPAACVCRDSRAVVEHKLYWAAVSTEQEAHYLASLLGSEATRVRVEHLQSRGQFGARDFDKVMFNLPIPRFDASRLTHAALAEAGAEAEQFVAGLDLDPESPFQRVRGQVRAALREAGISDRIDDLVNELLGPERG
jgi:hypothetical protein